MNARRTAASRLSRRVSVVIEILGRRGGRYSARVERLLLPLAILVFLLSSAVAFLNVPEADRAVRWPLLALVGAVGVPLVVLLNAAEYSVSARILGHRPRFGDALRTTLLAAAANQLPVPGSVLIRIRALRRLGSSYWKAGSSTATLGLMWLATTGIVVGAFQLLRGRQSFGIGALAAGLGLLLLASLAVSAHAPVRPVGLVLRALTVETATVLVSAFRYYLVLQGLGLEGSPSQAAALTVALVLASAIGFFPGGLGVRELLAAGFSPLVALDPAVGVLATAVDRLIGLVVLSALAILVLWRWHGRGDVVTEPPQDVPPPAMKGGHV